MIKLSWIDWGQEINFVFFWSTKIYFYPVNYKKKLCGGWLVMSSRGRRKEKTKVDQWSLTMSNWNLIWNLQFIVKCIKKERDVEK